MSNFWGLKAVATGKKAELPDWKDFSVELQQDNLSLHRKFLKKKSVAKNFVIEQENVMAKASQIYYNSQSSDEQSKCLLPKLKAKIK